MNKMERFKALGIMLGATLLLGIVLWEALLLTLFSVSKQFWYAGQALAAAIFLLALGVTLRRHALTTLTIGTALLFSISAALILIFDLGMPDGYVARMEISLPNWHFTVFNCLGISFGIIPLFTLIALAKKPNKSL